MRLRPLACARTSPVPQPLLTGAGAWRCAALLLSASLVVPAVRAQSAEPPGKAPAAVGASPKLAVSRPLWVQLTLEQQDALRPLAPLWDGLSDGHKRKWLALSRNYASMKPQDQAMLHSRMSDWASLSFHQRAQARLNFAEIQQLATDERKTKWEAYQALSEEERARLAKRAGPGTPGAALALQPVPAQKLAPIPAVSPTGQYTPRIQLGPPPASTAPPRRQGAPVAAEAQVPPPEPSAPQ